jgi:hypothetical protein
MAGVQMAIISVVALEKVVWIFEVGDRLADMPSTSDLGPLLNDTSLEALPNETLLTEALLTETGPGVVWDLVRPNSRICNLLNVLVLDVLCDDDESLRRKSDDWAEEPEEFRVTGKCEGLRAPPGTPVALEKDDLCWLRVFEMEGMLDREAFELLRIVGMTEYITYMNALDVCFEWFHEFLTLKDGI